jgi:glycerol uptake facilitator-like aquaporin
MRLCETAASMPLALLFSWLLQGCFTHLGGKFIKLDQLFGWELVMTFLLVSVVFAVAVTKPGNGNIGPLAVVS